MKKILALFSIFLTTLFSFTNTQALSAIAATSPQVEENSEEKVISTQIIPLNEDYYLEVITSDTTDPQTAIARTTYSKTASKTHNIKNVYGTTVASYTLSAKFTYNGSTSSCTSASHTESISVSGWKFSSATASWSGNKAIGSYLVKCDALNQSITKTITITCDANGNIQ